jgi:hypothetical protein
VRIMNLRRTTILSVVAAVATLMISAPTTALAAPPTSAVEVSPTNVQRGQSFTVKQTVYNADPSSAISGGKATLYGKERSLPDSVELVSCPGAFACDILGTSVRGGVGTVAPGESKTVTFTLRVKENAPLGEFTLQHQFVGENYSFEIIDGPVLTITDKPSGAADLMVGMDASPKGILTSKIDYTVTVANIGPNTATGIRLATTIAPGLRFAGSNQCTGSSGSNTVHCDFASVAVGTAKSAKFSVSAGLLSLGSLKSTTTVAQSTPPDPKQGNNSASVSCMAVTGLLIRC